MKTNIIAILSDLGVKDYFAGAMKGAILSVNPNAKIVDITHEVPKHDVRTAAFTLAQAAETFPKNSIFVAVVDPGVGTKRKCILLQTKNGLFFVGPDNGLFTLVAERFGIAKAYEIINKALMTPEISPTFHGRDIMAPVAAHLSLGLNPAKVWPQLKSIEMLEIPEAKSTATELQGCILNIDRFGNLVTNIGAQMISGFAKLEEKLKVKICGKVLVTRFARTFGEVAPREYVCYVGSSGMLELAENRGDLAGKLKVKIGEKLTVGR